jgi:hypothetical protein
MKTHIIYLGLLCCLLGTLFANQNVDRLAAGLEKLSKLPPKLPPRSEKLESLLAKPEYSDFKDYFEIMIEVYQKEPVRIFKEALSKNIEVAKKFLNCNECLNALAHLVNKSPEKVIAIAADIEQKKWGNLTKEQMLKQLKPAQDVDIDVIGQEIKNENLKIAWENLKKQDVAAFYKTYQTYKDFFVENPKSRAKLINELQDALRPKDPTKFDLAALNIIKERIAKDRGYFIGRDQYLLNNLKETEEQQAFAQFLQSKEGKIFKEALVGLLGDKSSLTLPDVVTIINTIAPYIIGKHASEAWKSSILAALQGTLANAQKKLLDQNFYVANPQIYKEILNLATFFQKELKDEEFAQFIKGKNNVQFASFLTSQEPEAKALLNALITPNEKATKKTLSSIRAEIDEDIADKIVKSYLANDKKIAQFIARIQTGFNVGQLKQQWPWHEEEEEE